MITRTFDENGNVDIVCDAKQVCTQTLYNQRNQPFRRITAGVVESTTWYWDNGLVRQHADGEDRRSYFLYDDADRLTVELAKDTNTGWELVERNTYRPGTELVTERRSGGLWATSQLGTNQQNFGYTLNGLLKQVTTILDGPDQISTNTFWPDGRIHLTTEKRGAESKTVASTYGPTGALVEVIDDSDGLQLITAIVNDPWGRPISVTNARLRATLTDYDIAGRIVRISEPQMRPYDNGATASGSLTRPETVFGWDAFGNQTDVVDPGGNHMTTTFDHYNRRVMIEHPTYTRFNGTTIDDDHELFFYDLNGNLSRKTDRRGYDTDYEYDAFNRVVEIREPQNSAGAVPVTTFGYDDVGNAITVTDATGAVTETTYNRFNQPLTINRIVRDFTFDSGFVSPSEDSMQEFTYDTHGNQLTATSAQLITTTYGYDNANRLVSVTDADAVVRSYKYNHLGDITRVTHPGGGETVTNYDTAGRATMVTEHGNDGTIVTRTSYVVDEVGNIKTSTSREGRTTTFDYDSANRLKTTTTPTSSDPGAAVITTRYGYDTRGFTWTNQNELETHHDPVTDATTTYVWNDASQIKSATSGTMSRTFGYRDNGLLLIDRLKEDTATRYYQWFNYDNDANIVTRGQYLFGQEQTRDYYEYDGANRLITWSEKIKDAGVWPTNPDHITEYQYDKAGNRTHKIVDGAAEQWFYDERNRITSGPDGQYEWDPRGTLESVTKDGIETRYQFDAFGDMVLVDEAGAGNIIYEYDALGRVANRDAGGDQVFQYSGFWMDPANDGENTFGRSPTGNLTSQQQGNNDGELVGLDRFGDVVYLADLDGRPTETTNYTPFGEIHNHWPTADDDPIVGFQGDWTDPDTGDVNTGARWYTPSSATFRSRDTYSGQLETPVSLNRYTYANNNPIRYWDPTGFFSVDAYMRQSAAKPKIAGLGGAIASYQKKASYVDPALRNYTSKTTTYSDAGLYNLAASQPPPVANKPLSSIANTALSAGSRCDYGASQAGFCEYKGTNHPHHESAGSYNISEELTVKMAAWDDHSVDDGWSVEFDDGTVGQRGE